MPIATPVPRRGPPQRRARTPIVAADVSPDAVRFPVIAALDALAAWESRPTRSSRNAVRRALENLAKIAEAAGAYLVVDAEPLRPLAVGAGSLRRRPGGGRAGRPGVNAYELRAIDGRLSLGTFWLDRPGPTAHLAVRALGRAVYAAWGAQEAIDTTRRLEALDVASRAVAGVLSLDRVLQVIADRVRDLVGARYAALGTADQEGEIDRFITSGISRAERERIGDPPRGHGLLGKLIREGTTLRIDDMSAHPDAYGFPENHPHMRSLLGVPLVVKGRVVGDLYLTEKEGGQPFTERDQRIVELFALHAAIAIDNARLHEQISRLAVVEERERIGKDLHDGIIQAIYAVGLSLEDVPELMDTDKAEAVVRVDRAIEHLNLAIRDIRNFIFGLRPELLEQAGLQAGLTALADEFRLNTMIDVDLVFDGREGENLSDEDTLQLLHIAREALSNVARHSKATRALISLANDDGELRLAIADNGRGFPVDAVRGPGHQGLANMRGRAAGMGGRLEVESTPGDGTRIILLVPPRDDDLAWPMVPDDGWPALGGDAT
ncbi:MAG TPA: GAF domain-containing sensor histidine kinase [Candidatus Limnocylindrales bacterium]